MKLFDKILNTEIFSNINLTGSEQVITCLTQSKNNIIANKIFGLKSRGSINGNCIPDNLIFDCCEFNYVDFKNLKNCTFINCIFNKCLFFKLNNITIQNCTGKNNTICSSTIDGKCKFLNCNGIEFNIKLSTKCEIIAKDTPELEKIIKNIEKERTKEIELRKTLKYGYKIIRCPVLIKLSFPDDAEIVNLDKNKSRASFAKVESIQIVNNFIGEGVTNTNYSKPCRYEVGKLVFPDYFDPNPEETCGNGIHFCKDISDLITYGGITSEELEYIKYKNPDL